MLVPSLWKHPPISGLTKFLNPPFAGFSCLADPPKSKTLLNVPPPIFYFIIPFLNFSGVQRERERKTTPFLNKSPCEKSNTPLFYNSRAGLCHTKSTPLPEILGTRMRSLRPRSGGGGGAPQLKKKFSKIIIIGQGYYQLGHDQPLSNYYYCFYYYYHYYYYYYYRISRSISNSCQSNS